MSDVDRDWERRLHRWALRPPKMPARAAARAVVARIDAGPGRAPALRWALAAAVTAVVAVVGLRIADAPRGAGTTSVQRVAPLPENVVQWWLDPETPVYFVTGPPGPEKGGMP